MGGSSPTDTSTTCVSKRQDVVPEAKVKTAVGGFPLPAGHFLEMEEDDPPPSESLFPLEDPTLPAAAGILDDDDDDDDEPHCDKSDETVPPRAHELHVDQTEKKNGQNNHRRRVSFSSLEIRRYSVVIGDHPCCSFGCPLSLGWEYDQSKSQRLSVDYYEATRSPRRSRQELRTSSEERSRMLAEGGGYTEAELRRAQRKHYRARSCSAKLCERVSDAFFREYAGTEAAAIISD